MNTTKDLTGLKFNRLTVIGISPKKGRQTYWLCKCSCGNTCTAFAYQLKSGKVKSCGCYRKRIFQNIDNTTHGMSNTSEYNCWDSIKRKCTKPNSYHWGIYGAHGIKICKRWLDSFNNFFKDMGLKPSSKHSIDRIDNSGHYSCGKCSECIKNNWPANCRWATAKQQARNRRNGNLITYKGQTKTVMEWSEITGISHYALYNRIRRNWPTEHLLDPLRK